MTSNLKFTSAAATEIHTLVTAYNAAYSDYVLPIQATPQTLTQIQQVSDVDFGASVVAWQGVDIVGFGFLGVRGLRGWMTSIAVLPQFRQQGIGRAIMMALGRSAKSYGLIQLQLEVNQENATAVALYQSLGFTPARRIFSVGCDEPMDTPSIIVRDTTSSQIITQHMHYHAIRPNWAREAASLRHFDYLTWYTGTVQKPQAYAMGYVWSEVITLVDVGCLPGQEDALYALLGELHKQHPDCICRMMGVGEDEPAWGVMQALGYETVMTEYEMLCTDVDSLLRIR